MIDYRLKTFIDLCETKSYTKTALNLSITQPAVSQHIKYLEDIYKLKLFSYVNKKLNLTEDGTVFFNNIQKLHTMAINIENHIKESNKYNNTLVFGATRTIGEYYLPYYLKKYLLHNPKIKVSMVVNNTKYLLDNLNKGNIEFAIIEGHFNKSDYETYLLSEERLVVVASPNNKLASLKKINLEVLFNETLIFREKGSGSREIFEMFLYENNYSHENFSHIIEVGNINVIKDFIKDDFGISIMYERAIQEELNDSKLIILDVVDLDLYHEFNYIFLKDSIYSSSYLSFYNFINNHKDK